MIKTTLTFKRPNGKIEEIDVSEKFRSGINSVLAGIIRRDTRAAGRGELIDWRSGTDATPEQIAAIQAASAAQAQREWENSTAGREARIFKNDL